jgi:hypothetical protein
MAARVRTMDEISSPWASDRKFEPTISAAERERFTTVAQGARPGQGLARRVEGRRGSLAKNLNCSGESKAGRPGPERQ